MRIHRFAPFVTATALALASLSPRPATAQTAEERAAARSLAQQGAEALQNQKYAEAVDLLGRAEAIIHAPTHLLLIGRAQVGLGKLVAARETFLKITREELAASAPSAFKRAQEDAKTELAAVEPRIASLRIVLGGPGASDPSQVTVELDEQAVTSALIGVHRPIDPGKHVIRATSAGHEPVTQEVSLGDGEKKDVTLEVETPTQSAGSQGGTGPGGETKPPVTKKGLTTLQFVGIGGMGLGAVGLVVGGVFGGMSLSKSGEAEDLFNDCNARGCTEDEKDQIGVLDDAAASRGTAAIIGLAAGAALVGGGVALFLVGGKKQPTTSSMVLPYVTPKGLGVVGTF